MEVSSFGVALQTCGSGGIEVWNFEALAVRCGRRDVASKEVWSRAVVVAIWRYGVWGRDVGVGDMEVWSSGGTLQV